MDGWMARPAASRLLVCPSVVCLWSVCQECEGGRVASMVSRAYPHQAHVVANLHGQTHTQTPPPAADGYDKSTAGGS